MSNDMSRSYFKNQKISSSIQNSRLFSTKVEPVDEATSSIEFTELDRYEIWTTDSSYGLLKVFDPIKYFMLDNWIYIADDLGLGFGVGIVLTSLLIRLAFTPLTYYAQKNGLRFRLIQEDIIEINQRINQLKDNQKAQMAEMMKMSELKKRVGIKNYIVYFSLLQLPLHIASFLLCNEISLNVHLYQTVQFDGFLWFSDLSFPDEYSVLPVLSTVTSFINIMSTASLSTNEITR
jgi:YidC/Oxa1 family membrane protein insertase